MQLQMIDTATGQLLLGDAPKETMPPDQLLLGDAPQETMPLSAVETNQRGRSIILVTESFSAYGRPLHNQI